MIDKKGDEQASKWVEKKEIKVLSKYIRMQYGYRILQ